MKLTFDIEPVEQARQNQKAKVKTVGARNVNGEKKIN